MTDSDRRHAIVLDLYNTLVPGGGSARRDEVSRQMARVLDVEPQQLAELVRRTLDERMRGRLGGLVETVRWLARELGAAPDDQAVRASAELRLAMTRQLHEQTWAVGPLTALRRAGVPVAVVSDCSAETPAIWSSSPLRPFVDAVSFSCLTGFRKPEPEAYLVALEQLGVPPRECVYVGDGDSFELVGATELGMNAYCFAGGHRGGARIDDDHRRPGQAITDLNQIVDLMTTEPGR